MSSEPSVARVDIERGIRLPDGEVVVGADIPDHKVPGEVEVRRTRTVYHDDESEWWPVDALRVRLVNG